MVRTIMGKAAPEAVEAAMAILQAVPDGKLNIVLLNKVMFYLDLVALRDLGNTVTNCAYVALEKGPVVAKYDTRLIPTLEDLHLAHQLHEGMAKPIQLDQRLESFKVLTEEQLALVPGVVKAISKLSSTAASDFSHLNPGWQIAWRKGGGSSNKPLLINMLIAMQQLAGDRDPWLDEEVDVATREVASRARSVSRGL